MLVLVYLIAHELALYHYKARAYSPMLGRFMQTDPVGYKDDLNLNAYVGNDPLNHTDPTGMVCNQERTVCTSDTYNYDKAKSSGVDVRHDPKVDNAAVAARGDYQKPTVKGGEPTGLAKVTDDGVKVTPTESKPGNTTTADTAKFSVAGADAGVHGHLGGTVTDDPASNKGYGDTQSLKAAKEPMYTVEGNRVGVHDAPHGHLRFEMVNGTMTADEARVMQNNLNREQRLFQ